ncbi:hypothetical protein SS50377_28545 [Spironucleus salmonicida]|uniref:Uncharacterized protein n=1 Tax=Spironucleus salmonicida TaxID=348837 RepID=V6LLP2_9EUKA|nr:hypothetical protein SS50377_28545 [Spironucleus salmonicida]|eukprot:EST41624.1 Hypothetical protein SS50377_18977 [Spironucleus salmonicida]
MKVLRDDDDLSNTSAVLIAIVVLLMAFIIGGSITFCCFFNKVQREYKIMMENCICSVQEITTNSQIQSNVINSTAAPNQYMQINQVRLPTAWGGRVAASASKNNVTILPPINSQNDNTIKPPQVFPELPKLYH